MACQGNGFVVRMNALFFFKRVLQKAGNMLDMKYKKGCEKASLNIDYFSLKSGRHCVGLLMWKVSYCTAQHVAFAVIQVVEYIYAHHPTNVLNEHC